MEQHPPAPAGQLPGKAVGVADGEHRQPGFPLRLELQAIARPVPGLEGPHAGHPGPEGQGRAEARPLAGGPAAGDAVKGNPGPDIGAGLGRQVQKAGAGLDVDLPGVQALLPKAVQSAVEPVQLGLGEGLPPQVVGDAEVGEDPGDPQLPPPEEPLPPEELPAPMTPWLVTAAPASLTRAVTLPFMVSRAS